MANNYYMIFLMLLLHRTSVILIQQFDDGSSQYFMLLSGRKYEHRSFSTLMLVGCTLMSQIHIHVYSVPYHNAYIIATGIHIHMTRLMKQNILLSRTAMDSGIKIS